MACKGQFNSNKGGKVISYGSYGNSTESTAGLLHINDYLKEEEEKGASDVVKVKARNMKMTYPGIKCKS